MKLKNYYCMLVFLLFGIMASLAQEKVISGSVSDKNGLSLPGASILIKGTSNGVSTDFDGNYSITANTGDVLVYSFIGYVTQEIGVDSKSTINIVLNEDTQALDEVVVTAFGIKRNPKQLGYAVSTVESDEVIENSEPDLIRSLSGKVAGVNVNFSTGVAGASNQINIRGATTIGSSSQPLIIVDGIAYSNTQTTTVDLAASSSQSTGGGGYESGLSSLDPNDIATINVLKSTAASALYGSRAADGVIVITTKSGSGSKTSSKMKVNVSSGTYFETIANLPEYQNKYGNGTKFGYENANGSWGPAYNTLETIPTWPALLTAFPDQFGPTVPYEAQPNNVKDLFKTGVTQDNSVNLSYGNQDGSFGITISDLAQEGYIPFNTYDRTSVSVGGNFRLNEKLTIGGSLSYSDTKQIGAFFGENQFNGSASSFARTLWLGRTWDLSLPYEDPVTGGSVIPNGSGWDHPLWSWEHDQIITNTNRTVSNINFSYQINDNISASYRLGVNKYSLDRKEIRDIGSRSDNGVGAITIDAFSNEDIESTLLFNFNYDLTEDIGFTGILGNNLLQNTQERHAIIGNTFISPGIYTIENNLNITLVNPTPTNGIGYARKRNAGVFADVGLSYKDYLFVNATGRNDWSSTLPKDNNSYFYYSVSGSLIFSEAFKLDSDVLTFGKLRGGYAEVGRDAAAEFLNRTFAVGNAYSGVPVIGNRTTLGNVALTPEFTSEIELGLDLEFFKRRIVLDFSWYKKTTTDLISPVAVPSTSGFSTFNTNIGEMQNTGIEVGLTLVPVQTENFKWSLFTTYAKNTNEVIELVEGVERITLNANEVPHAIVGEPFGVFYGTRFARDDSGNFLINPSNGGIFEEVESGIIGDPTPDFKMSFINNIRYKNWNLKSQIDWREGGDISSTSIQLLLGRGVTRDTENREVSHILPGFYGTKSGQEVIPLLDGNGNPIPNTVQLDTNELYFSPSTTDGNTFGINSVDESDIHDGTVYRLRELSLSYDVPSKWLKKTPFTQISLSAVGNNLWYFAPNVPKYTNFDPEVTSFGSTRLQGIEIAAAPTSKRYGFKVNLTF